MALQSIIQWAQRRYCFKSSRTLRFIIVKFTLLVIFSSFSLIWSLKNSLFCCFSKKKNQRYKSFYYKIIVKNNSSVLFVDCLSSKWNKGRARNFWRKIVDGAATQYGWKLPEAHHPWHFDGSTLSSWRADATPWSIKLLPIRRNLSPFLIFLSPSSVHEFSRVSLFKIFERSPSIERL